MLGGRCCGVADDWRRLQRRLRRAVYVARLLCVWSGRSKSLLGKMPGILETGRHDGVQCQKGVAADQSDYAVKK